MDVLARHKAEVAEQRVGELEDADMGYETLRDELRTIVAERVGPM